MKRWSVIGAVLLVAVWMVARRDPQLRSYDLAPDHDWQQAGFERLELPIHLPSADPDIDQVEIWIQIPQGQRIDLAADGSATLSFPPGTVLDRVEFAGAGPARQVVDVRGTRLDDQGRQWFHVVRRGGGPKAALVGYEWQRDDHGAHEAVTTAMLDVLRQQPQVARMGEVQRDRVLASFRDKNECAACHESGRPDNTVQDQFGLVNRGTDADGFFAPATVLRDVVPLERYGRFDRNETDPSVTVACPQGPAELADRGQGRRYVCPGQGIPLGRFDWELAQQSADPRAAKICASRQWLWARMTTRAQAMFRSAMEPCRAMSRPSTPV